MHWMRAWAVSCARRCLAEGLAVYLVGGHFKPEPLRLRAAVLLPPLPGCMPTIQTIAARPDPAQVCSLGGYQPLSVLAGQFYTTQHEIGYLEAGALVDYMVRTYGWQAFSAFYRDIHPYPSGSQASAIQVALQKHFGVTLEELDQSFQADLSRQALDPRQVLDVRLSIEYYDAIRRYQQYYDPSAYFLTAWLPEASQMRRARNRNRQPALASTPRSISSWKTCWATPEKAWRLATMLRQRGSCRRRVISSPVCPSQRQLSASN